MEPKIIGRQYCAFGRVAGPLAFKYRLPEGPFTNYETLFTLVPKSAWEFFTLSCCCLDKKAV